MDRRVALALRYCITAWLAIVRWALLGLIFLPWTTLMFVIIFPIVGFDWLWIGLALMADIAATGRLTRTTIAGLPDYQSAPAPCEGF